MSKAITRPLTPDERLAIEAMRGVTFTPASFEKRFARNVLFPALQTNALSDKASAQLWRIFIRYRRQISHPDKARLLKLAENLAAPDFRKQRAAENERARIEQMKKEANQ